MRLPWQQQDEPDTTEIRWVLLPSGAIAPPEALEASRRRAVEQERSARAQSAARQSDAEAVAERMREHEQAQDADALRTLKRNGIA